MRRRDSGEFSSIFEAAKVMAERERKQKGKPPISRDEEDVFEIEGLPKLPEEIPERKEEAFEDIESIMARAKKMHDDIKRRIEQSYDDAEIHPKQMREFLNDPTNFSSKSWEEMRRYKNELRRQEQIMRDKVGAVPPVEEQPSSTLPQEAGEKKVKKIKRGVPRGRWIQT